MNRFVGLTGGIAAGKSAVVKILREQNVRVIDCDQLAREAVEPGSSCLKKIVSVFGPAAINIDGSMNRQFVAGQIFADPGKRLVLENIIHPYVKSRMLAECQEGFSRGEQLVVADVPLLFEVGWQQLFVEIWLVVCDDGTRISRIMTRDGIDSGAAELRLAAQLPQIEKIRLADRIIDNNTTLCDLEQQVVRLISRNNYQVA